MAGTAQGARSRAPLHLHVGTPGAFGSLARSTHLSCGTQNCKKNRASGAFATRDEFLIDLANPLNRRDRIDAIGEIACQSLVSACAAFVLIGRLLPPSNVV